MTKPESFSCILEWDKLAPGKLRYRLGPLELVSEGRIYRRAGDRFVAASVTAEKELILLRNILLRYPNYLSVDEMVDRIYPDPDIMPDTFVWCVRQKILRLRSRLQKLGLKIPVKHKVGYRLEIIEDWNSGIK